MSSDKACIPIETRNALPRAWIKRTADAVQNEERKSMKTIQIMTLALVLIISSGLNVLAQNPVTLDPSAAAPVVVQTTPAVTNNPTAPVVVHNQTPAVVVATVTPDSLANSPLSYTQKGEIAQMLIDGDVKAGEVFGTYLTEIADAEAKALAEAEAAKLQEMVQAAAEAKKAEAAKLQAAADAELKAQQTKITGEVDALLTPLSIDQVWPAIVAYADTVARHEGFIANLLAKRYTLVNDKNEAGFYTIDEVQTAYNERSNARKAKIARHLEMAKIATSGDKIEASERIAGDETNMAALAMVITKVDSLEADMATMRNDLNAVTNLAGENRQDIDSQNGDIEALKRFIVMTDSNGEVNEASEERFNNILRDTKRN
jgi:hypothetical protein